VPRPLEGEGLEEARPIVTGNELSHNAGEMEKALDFGSELKLKMCK